MAIDEKLLKSVIAEVLKEMNTADTSAASAVEGETYECPGMQITEIGDAEKGTNPNEVVLGLAPAFGESQTTNIVGIPHADMSDDVRRELKKAFRILYRSGLSGTVRSSLQRSASS